MRFYFFISGLLVTGAVSAQVPSVPLGPEGVIYTCEQQQDELGCYGAIYDAFSVEVGLTEAKSYIRSLIRTNSRARRRSKRLGERGESVEYAGNVAVLRKVRTALRRCYAYDDPSCAEYEPEYHNETAADVCDAFGGVDADIGNDVHIRIINGALCSLSNTPIVPIEVKGAQHCTGNVISDTVILTAAHCVEDLHCRHLSVVNAASGVRRNVKRCAMHPSYNGYEDHDIGLLFLDESIGTEIMPVHTTNDIKKGEEVIFAGYGISEDDDYPNLRGARNVLSWVSKNGLEIEYVNGDTVRGNSCNGDSGGPLAIFRDGQWVLIGVVSNGDADNCALPGYEESDISRWTNITAPLNLAFLADHTSGIVD